MHYIRKISLLLAAIVLGLLSQTAEAQNIGNCERSVGESFLDINNVRAKILNNGGLFWNGGANIYEIPKGGGHNTIFASGIWVGGQVGGQLRMAASTYGPWEFWSGPLNDDGTAPADCSPWDRIWKVSKEDVVAYEGSGAAIPDLADWPTGLGAPTLDANGDLIDLLDQPLASRVDRKINLGAGERPAILGDQMLWWIMNDRGNTHENTDTPPIGLEAHGSAFAFNTAGAIGNTTFYKFRLFYKGTQPLEQTYMAIYSDPDLGAAFDDYVGSDTTLGLGYVYNADNDDDGNYGANVPASGYDFFQGPLVDNNGRDDDRDGTVDEPGERLQMTAFGYYNNGGGATGDPSTGPDFYNNMQGRWKDGLRYTFGGDGRTFSTIPTNFVFPGDPESREFWTELNSDGQGTAIPPADRRFFMSTGPFTINPGDEQELVFGLVTSFGTDHLNAVTQMKADDALAQAVFDIDFALPSPPAGPRVTVTELNNSVTLDWGYNPTDNNYLDSYVAIDPLLSPDIADRDYVFEGYNVYRFASTSDIEGTLIATYDVVNGVTRVIEGLELTFVTAEGSDSGLAHSHTIDGLTNYTTYEFGVQAYAYNAVSGQKVYPGPVTRVSAVPSRTDLVLSDAAVAAKRANASVDIVATPGENNVGDGSISADVVNPARVTGASYSVNFYTVNTDDLGKNSIVRVEELEEGDIDGKPAMGGITLGKSAGTDVVTYDVINNTTGGTVFDGTATVANLGTAPPQGNDVVQFDGLAMNVGGAPDDIAAFLMTANANGPLDPPEMGTFAFNGNGFPILDYTADGIQNGRGDRPTGNQQANGSTWGLATGRSSSAGASGNYATFISRALRNGWGDIVPNDFEVRFTAECYNAWRAAYDAGEATVTNPTTDGCYLYDRFGQYDGFSLQYVPFEVWHTGIGTKDDTSDDFRMIVAGIDWSLDGWGIDPDDHPVSGGTDDPQTDWSYWYLPVNRAPGEAGYTEWLTTLINTCYPQTPDCNPVNHGGEPFSRMVFVNWNGGSVAGGVFDADMPEAGTVFRIETTKPNQPGDSFAFSTDGLGARAKTEAENISALDEIGIVPNPYKGASAYEVSQLVDQVRFTNMPNTATIRVFTLNGTLIRTLEKNSPANMFPWDLTTEEGLPIASGMYIIHVETDLGERVLKFGVVKKRIQLNNF